MIPEPIKNLFRSVAFANILLIIVIILITAFNTDLVVRTKKMFEDMNTMGYKVGDLKKSETVAAQAATQAATQVLNQVSVPAVAGVPVTPASAFRSGRMEGYAINPLFNDQVMSGSDNPMSLREKNESYGSGFIGRRSGLENNEWGQSQPLSDDELVKSLYGK